MKALDSLTLLTLAAVWGSSYLFLRLGAGDFGPVPLAAVRALGAALLLSPFWLRRPCREEFRQYWRPILLVGVLHSALPYLLFSYASLSITAGLAAILTATTPHFGALVSRGWFGARWSRGQAVGLALGLCGVGALLLGRSGLQPGASAPARAILAGLAAALLYAIAASYSKRSLGQISPSTVAAGTQLSAGLLLLGPALLLWPPIAPSTGAWGAALALAAACTALAYLLFFRLVQRVGATRTVTVTFLIPAFGLLWGWAFLDETITGGMIASVGLILVGTALSTGVISFPLVRLTWPSARRSPSTRLRGESCPPFADTSRSHPSSTRNPLCRNITP